MRTFVYYICSRKTRRNLPGYNLEICIHELIDNAPSRIGFLKVCTASYKGEDSEVMNFLGREGIVDKSFSDGYYRQTPSFRIISL